MTTFDRIKEISKKRGYSLKETALKAGLSENAIYRYNQGIEPKYPTLKAIADALNISVDYLLGKTDNPSTTTKPKEVDIEDKNVIMTYEGKPIPPEDLEIMKRFLNGGMGNDKK